MKPATLIFAFVCVFTGCASEQISPSSKIDTPMGMADYLQKKNLPALEKTEDWSNDYGPGLKITTAHYEIYTTLLEPLMLSQVPGFVESAYRAYNQYLPYPIESQNKFTIYLFAYRKQWEDFSDKFDAKQAKLYKQIKAGAYYANGACVAYNIGIERTFSVLAHEGWHQFNSRHFKYRLPSWLDEGIAMQFEASRNDRGLFYFEPEKNLYRLGSLKQTLTSNKMMPIKNLVGMNPGEAVVTSDESVAAYYSQAYAMVRFLREDNYGKRLTNYNNMLLGGLNGQWPLDDAGKKIASDRNIPMTVSWNRFIGQNLFKTYVGEFDLIENEYKAFCAKIVYHVRIKKID